MHWYNYRTQQHEKPDEPITDFSDYVPPGHARTLYELYVLRGDDPACAAISVLEQCNPEERMAQ